MLFFPFKLLLPPPYLYSRNWRVSLIQRLKPLTILFTNADNPGAQSIVERVIHRKKGCSPQAAFIAYIPNNPFKRSARAPESPIVCKTTVHTK